MPLLTLDQSGAPDKEVESHVYGFGYCRQASS